MPEPDPSVTIVMPAYNAAHLLPRSLPAALAAADGADVVVGDPGSTDHTATVAQGLGASVIRMGERAGPAAARNAGCEGCSTDLVLFLDADCVAADDVVRRVKAAFATIPELVSLTGSYDDAPPEQNFASLYMNLRHHHTHQTARRDRASFWAGCGAVRLDVFREVGGFDPERYPRPMIEDIELGLRMREHGRTGLDPALNVAHLKRWTLRSVIHTDVLCRAVPWTRLIRDRGEMPDDLNLKKSQRVAALVAPLALAAVPALPLCLAFAPAWAGVPAAAIAAAWVLNRHMLGFFKRTCGWWFAVRAFLFHQVHLIYSAATFVVTSLLHRTEEVPS